MGKKSLLFLRAGISKDQKITPKAYKKKPKFLLINFLKKYSAYYCFIYIYSI